MNLALVICKLITASKATQAVTRAVVHKATVDYLGGEMLPVMASEVAGADKRAGAAIAVVAVGG